MTPLHSAHRQCADDLERPVHAVPAMHRSMPAEFELRVFR
jgi:hypothetical protein